MDEKWTKLVEQFIEAGYGPHDIQRIVMVYEMAKENDDLLKKWMDKESLLSE